MCRVERPTRPEALPHAIRSSPETVCFVQDLDWSVLSELETGMTEHAKFGNTLAGMKRDLANAAAAIANAANAAADTAR